MNLMRVAGAGLAGLLLILFDYGEVYLLDAVIYAGAIWTTLQMSAPQETSNGTQGRRHGSLMKEFAEGFRYINKNRAALYLVGMALVLFVLGQPYQQVFVPLLAINVLDIGRSGAGWMLALTGVGALIGSLTVASWGSLPHRGLLMMGLLAFFSLALILLSLSGSLPLSAVALILAGGMTTSYMALNNSLLLEQAPPQFHGRIMSLMSLDRGMISIGAILSGAMAELLGPQMGLMVLAGLCLGLTILLFLLAPALRKMS